MEGIYYVLVELTGNLQDDIDDDDDDDDDR